MGVTGTSVLRIPLNRDPDGGAALEDLSPTNEPSVWVSFYPGFNEAEPTIACPRWLGEVTAPLDLGDG